MNLTQDVAVAVECLKQGIPVAFPTETVYGLGANVFNPEAVEAVFKMKGRPSDNPLICHISDLNQLEILAREIPQEAYLLASHFWPGPLTLILKKQPQVPTIVTGGLDSVAVRMPRHPLALELIRRAGEPLVGPSANQSGRPSSTDPSHVLSDFTGMTGVVLDGGVCKEGIESTVLYLAGEKPLLLRPGMIGLQQIENVLKCQIEIRTGSHASPGTRYKHYAPNAKVHIFDSFEKVPVSSRKRFYMSTDEHPGFHLLTTHTLYGLLRRADSESAEEVIIVCSALEHPALRNRLFRAAGLTVL